MSLNADQLEIEKLISRIALGDRDAFSELYDKTADKLFSMCMGVLHDENSAADCLQDAYVKIWKNAERYQANGLSPMTWLITIARNTAIDRSRSNRSEKNTSIDDIAELEDSAQGPEDSADVESQRAEIERCLRELEEPRADAIRKAYLHGASYAELAKANNVPVNTMRTWLRRSLQSLRGCLKIG